MIRILIVEDSPTEALLLKHLFEEDNTFQVVGHAKNGQEGVEMAKKLKPDVITMDIHMPVLDGLKATRVIMSSNPIPIVVISSTIGNDKLAMTYHALDAGALAVLPKPEHVGKPQFVREKKQMLDTIKAMSSVMVITKKRLSFGSVKDDALPTPLAPVSGFGYEIVAIGASVGGPQVIKRILESLPHNFPVPIVIVQHMAKGFMTGFTEWMNNALLLQVEEAAHNQVLQKSHVYFAPDDHHLEIKRIDDQLVAHLTKSAPVSGFSPSATVLFKSVAAAAGKKSIGILLTGMGDDGAEGLLMLKKAKGHTLIQDEETSIVFGMPGTALGLGAVDKVLSPDQLAQYLVQLFK